MRLLLALLAAWIALAAQPAGPPPDPLLQAMREELARSRSLRLGNLEPPYYIEYSLDDVDSFTCQATLGGLLDARRNRARIPGVQVRVGDYKFDNTNYVGTDYFAPTRTGAGHAPLDGPPMLLRRQLWLATDRAYKGAVEAIARKRAALNNITVGEQLDDFAKSEPVRMVLGAGRVALDEDGWTSRVRSLSALFQGYPEILESSIEFQSVLNTHYFVNTEGAEIRTPESVAFLRVRARTQAPDGAELWLAAMFHSLDLERLPSDLDLRRGVDKTARDLVALMRAPVGDSYSGPVLFEPEAAAQLFAEVLGRNLASSRRPVSEPGRPIPLAGSELENRLGSRILPEWIRVVDDPTQSEWRGQPLFGHYRVDMEGVPPAPLTLVEKGVLKDFLRTRQPVKGFSGSSGRARLPGSFGARTAAFGNLFVQATEAMPLADLKKKLSELCRAGGKPYGMVVRKMDFPSSASLGELRRLTAGMARSGGESRPVSVPLLLYRRYPDGREELVRGLRFRRLNVRSLKDILAASQETAVFDFLENGAPWAIMGAGSYAAESSVVAPSVLIDDLELERVDGELSKPPLVPPPPLAGTR